jgi:hypothetical protein
MTARGREAMLTMGRQRHNRFLSTITAAVFRGLRVVVAALAGMVLMAAALLFGAVLGALLLTWKLLRGRRPGVVNGDRPGPMPRSKARQIDVIDVEAREVATHDRRG